MQSTLPGHSSVTEGAQSRKSSNARQFTGSPTTHAKVAFFIAQGYLPRDSFVQGVEPSHTDHQSRQSLTDLATQASLIGTVSQLKFSFPGDSGCVKVTTLS